ncbi:helix-turn-helix transcriptional regulator [Jeotgalibaca sp. MA1X17-3]|uniref:PadR family transcriptional regulator n=1 Tax=Jeotgalibaca sp. MA1X17-3 TaxID=2908211 RepID=UPI001F1FBD04|nr:helix-turn-helix transcriptional regulator [Jeotgalibaca sp. MA1X17-3]UJF15556.1 helix-turn-helix transcriptional regulator [Jeotgalibaca sp. MA1X17-3]
MTSKINSQMLKGILSGSILLLLDQEELYGYKLSEALTEFGFTDIPKGTIYPLLLSLEKKELIKGTLRASDTGPKRKYYSLTEAGIIEKNEFTVQWNKLKKSVDHLIEGSDEDEKK